MASKVGQLDAHDGSVIMLYTDATSVVLALRSPDSRTAVVALGDDAREAFSALWAEANAIADDACAPQELDGGDRGE